MAEDKVSYVNQNRVHILTDFFLNFSVKIFYKDVFAKHAELFAELKVNVNNGM